MQQEKKLIEFLQQNSLDGGFLQSPEWLKFQQKVGRKIHPFQKENFIANIIEHTLPLVGKYLYVPRGPICKPDQKQLSLELQKLINLAKKENVGWIRIEPEINEIFEIIKENVSEKVIKAPHDMQPKEIFLIDILKTEQELLSQMKPKTRYNINLAKKKGVNVLLAKNEQEKKEHIQAFLSLTKEMAERQGITAHPEEYYRKMIESFSSDMLKLYVAEYEGEIIAANLILCFGKFATYLHGASANVHRNVMAPFLLQWHAILDAKKKGCESYDFGGVKVSANASNDWAGITNFKLGFSPNTEPVIFPGSYDIVINPRRYAVYRGLQRAKAFAVKLRKK